MPVIPASNLPPQSAPWGRSVDNRLQQAEFENAKSFQDIENSFKQLTSTVKQLQAQVTVLSGVVNALYSSNAQTSGGVLEVNAGVGATSPWAAFGSSGNDVGTVAVAVDVTDGGRLTILGSAIADWYGYKSNVEISYQVSLNSNGNIIIPFGSRNIASIANGTAVDAHSTLTVIDSVYGLAQGIYNVTLGVRARGGASEAVSANFTQRSIIAWAY
jgi:hypothetical protein